MILIISLLFHIILYYIVFVISEILPTWKILFSVLFYRIIGMDVPFATSKLG